MDETTDAQAIISAVEDFADDYGAEALVRLYQSLAPIATQKVAELQDLVNSLQGHG